MRLIKQFLSFGSAFKEHSFGKYIFTDSYKIGISVIRNAVTAVLSDGYNIKSLKYFKVDNYL